jgi:phage terminase large subunit-like protein
MTFRQFITEMVRVRDDETGELRAPVLHPEEERVVDAMDRRDPATGLRAYLTIVISWVRKAGKTFMDACIGIYALVFDEFHTHREVIVQASTKDQGASAVFKAMKRLVRANPWLNARIRITNDGMTYIDDEGIEHSVKVLPNNPGAVHG